MTRVHNLHALHLEYRRIKATEVEKDSLDDELLGALPWAIQTIWHEWCGGADDDETRELIRLGVLRDGEDGIEVCL